MATKETGTYTTSQGKVLPKRKPRTIKEKKFAKLVMEGVPQTTAALQVYDVADSKNPYKTASTIASENMEKLGFNDYFAAAGLTDTAIAANLTQAAYAEDDVLRDSKWTKVPDWSTRLKAHELAVKIMGKLAPTEFKGTINIEKIEVE